MNMQTLSTLNFEQQPVRIEMLNGEPLFCLKDVARALEIKNAKHERFQLDVNGVHKMYLTDNLGRQQQVTFITEPNLYRIIFRSNKTEAVKFQNWIFDEVLPQLRKTGHYGQDVKLVEQNQALQVELLKARPFWSDVIRYKQLGLATHEIAKLTERGKSTINTHIRLMQQLGYDVPSEPQPIHLQMSLLGE